ncbi:exosortase H-associated membrane protein [Gilvimarinus polysaccharolyticus]|uniref:exosortase H-associated membrane protein n=1 Tax=Gilvimarinus polysaccharolyticus TaxID=863921 RepID=UPI00067365DF|nr:exosortase H-associated membrane protein [Gilvimarinus polysaccharolyticus]
MPQSNFSPARYFFHVVLWLPIFFVLWYYLAGMLSIVPAHLSEWIINLISPGAVVQLDWVNRELEYVTRYTVPAADGVRTGHAVVSINPLLYSWNIPVLLALCYAVSDKLFSNKRVIIGVIALLPMHAWGLVAEFFVNVLFRMGDSVAEQIEAAQWQQEMAALLYQFGYLMLPVIGAVSVWFLVNQAWVQELINSSGQRARD